MSRIATLEACDTIDEVMRRQGVTPNRARYDVALSPRTRAPNVVVGMPVFNAEQHLAAAIESVLGQSFTDLELVICDNASTDRTAVICQRYVDADRRVRLLHNPVNMGANPNYRRVAQTSSGEYFKWASSNDLIERNYIERCVRALEERPDAVLAFGQTILFEDDPLKGVPYDDRMQLDHEDPYMRFRRCVERMRLNNVFNGVIRASVLRRTSMLADYMSSDNVLVAELALKGKIIAVPQARFYRRMDRHSATRLQSSEQVFRHHYPTDRRGGFFQSWQLARGYLNAVVSTALPLRCRLRALAFVARRTYWLLPQLAADVRDAFRFYRARNRT